MAGKDPRVLVLSQRGVDRFVWRASQFEFEDVVSAVTGARVSAPVPGTAGRGTRLLRRARSLAHRRLSLGHEPALPGAERIEAADVFFAVFSFPEDISHLGRLQGWQHSTVKIAFIVELWAAQVVGVQENLRRLEAFDHIFVFSRKSIPLLEALTGRPVHYLDTAVDALLFAPPAGRPADRCLDVYAYGRLSPVTHAALIDGLRADRVSYAFPSVAGRFEVADPQEHRLVCAHLLQRSRFTVVNRINDTPERLRRTAGEEALTNRYFEALAGGCVMLGTAARTDDFTRAFPWADAIIPIEPDEPRIVDVVDALKKDPERLARIAATNVAESLRRHDWAHRWAEICAVTGVARTDELDRRLEVLAAAASDVERLAGP